MPYFNSAMSLADARPDVDFLVTSGESHVTRARNNIAATFLTQTDYDQLFFIDADIEFSPGDVSRISNIGGVAGAAVACKTVDFSEFLSLWVDGKRPSRSQMPSEPFSVDYLGSAMLCIDRAVLDALTASDLVTEYRDPIIGEAWDFFRDGVSGDVWQSEDYGFCELCRAAGIEITCDPAVIVSHYGAASWRF